VKKVQSLKVNFIMNFIRVLTNLMFPVITFPYAARILFADGIGKVSFAEGVINYFVLLASLGVPLYGIRSVAKSRESKDKLSKLVKEILYINLYSTIIVIILFIIVLLVNKKISNERELFLVMSLLIICTNIGVEWFYQGIEDYTYITIRNLVFKLASLFLLFLIVRDETDYVNYAFVLIFGTCCSNILNFINLRKHINFQKKYKLDLKRHLRPIFLIFTFSIATSIYVNLDTVMLGYLSSDRNVGLYTAAVRITKIVVVLVTTLGGVLIPRISYYIEHKNFEEFRKVIKLSANFILFLGLPSIVGLYILAPEVINLFGGSDFSESITSMRIMLPIILFIGFSNLLGIQIMYNFGEEKSVIKSVLIGSIIHIITNLILIPKFGHIGAAISTLMAEGTVLIVQILLVRKLLKFNLFDVNSSKYVFSSFILFIVIINLPNLGNNIYYLIFMKSIIGIVVYISSLILFREKHFLFYFRKARF
jgi:O-antigen/teichoic acid export membrane protein